MPRYRIPAKVVYEGYFTIDADSVDDAQSIARQSVKPQGVVSDTLLGNSDGYEFDMHPEVLFGKAGEVHYAQG